MLGERFEVMKLAQTNASYQPISTNVPPLHPLKTENRSFIVIGGYRSGTLVENGLN